MLFEFIKRLLDFRYGPGTGFVRECMGLGSVDCGFFQKLIGVLSTAATIPKLARAKAAYAICLAQLQIHGPGQRCRAAGTGQSLR